MKIRAKISFCGVLSMGLGEVRECNDKAVLDDLLRAGYVEEVKDAPAEEKPKAKPKRAAKKAG